jgi:hypothetical protein
MKGTTLLSILAALAIPATEALKASTYVYASNDANITISLTAAADSQDLVWRVTFPAGYDWIGVGIGATMKDSWFLIGYPTKKGTCKE